MRFHSLVTLSALCLLATMAHGQAITASSPDAAEPKVRLMPASSNNIIFDMIESPDGTRLITHDRRRSPKLWEPKTMSLLRILGGNTEYVSVVTFSADGRSILTMSETEVRVWDARTSQLKASFPAGEGNIYSTAAISHDGQSVAVGTMQGKIRVHQVGNPLIIGESKFNEATDVRAIVATKSGKFVAVAPFEGMILDAKGAVTLRFKGWEPPSLGLDVSQDERSILVTVADSNELSDDLKATVIHLDASNGQVKGKLPHVFNFRMAAGTTNADAFGHFVGTDQSLIATFSPTGEIILTDRESGKAARKLTGNTSAIREIRVSRDGNRLATHTMNEGIMLWDIASGKSIPLDQNFLGPTAATFSTDNKTFWIGYSDGAMRRFDLGSTSFDERQIAATAEVTDVRFVGNGQRMLVTYKTELRGFSSRDAYRLWDLGGGDAPVDLGDLKYTMNVSPSGRMLWPDFSDRPDIYQVDNTTSFAGGGKVGSGFKVTAQGIPESFRQLWVAPNDKIVAFRIDEDLVFGDVSLEGKDVADVRFPKASKKDDLTFRLEFFGDNQTALVSDFLINGKEKFVRVNHRTGKVLWEMETDTFAMATSLDITKDDKWVVMSHGAWVEVFDATTGKKVRSTKVTGPDPNSAVQVDSGVLSADEKTILATEYNSVYVVDFATGKELGRVPSYVSSHLAQRVNQEQPWVLTTDSNRVTVYDYLTRKPVSSLAATDQVTQVLYTPDQRRIVTVDPTDGVTFYDAEPIMVDGKLTHKRLANFVTLTDPEVAPEDSRNLTWLAMDPAGRFDAADPNHVNGAKYVIRWSGGLEPVGVDQLKQVFYEPGLMGKILGSNPEAVRPVPVLDSLRLYPTLKVTKNQRRPNEIEVALNERDNGGIGKVRVFLNGKEIITRDGIGYFKFDTQDYKQYLLPETLLKQEGQKSNFLEVTVSNQEGTLTSPTALVDLGIPTDLAVPDVKVYALFAGTSDYVGDASDLSAPSNDARVLGATVKSLAESLLPGKVKVTTLSTADALPTSRPTRANILNWFKSVQSQATAGDIIMVFFSGHGTSQIGEKSGYFYLTSDADPGEMTELTASTATISGDDLRIALSAIPAKKQVVILDTCHSGAAQESLFAARSVPSDYQRAYESIRESTGTWVLAGSAADQLSYEAANVDHGMLTYSLLEAIDKATGDGMREAPGGELFLDVRTWLRYAAERVESLKNEVGLKAIQRPELKASPTNQSFDLGVLAKDKKGTVGLKPPKPIILLGNFSMDEEDPLNLEAAIQKELSSSAALKFWPEVTKHPNVHRASGTYTIEGDKVTVKLFIQFVDVNLQRTTKTTITLTGSKANIIALAQQIRAAAEKQVIELVNPTK